MAASVMKAGILGAVALIVLNLVQALGSLPLGIGCLFAPLACFTGCLSPILFLLISGGVGYLAARFADLAPGEYANGLLGGALAGAVASGIAGVELVLQYVVLSLLNISVKLPLDILQQQKGTGSELLGGALVGAGGAALIGSLVCIVGLVGGALFGALGGLINVLLKPKTSM